MKAGKLDLLVTVDQPVPSQSAAGEETIDWQPLFTTRASIAPLIGIRAGKEGLMAGQLIADADTIITLRWSLTSARITAKWRIRWRDTIFNIRSVSPVDYERAEIQIIASSGLNEG